MVDTSTPDDSHGKSVGKQRLGLALSGGGFRASFFHIGVLARMASLGLLRHVEVISTVSGGSIIGALYYLHVKMLLERVPDEQITDRHYQEIVERVERDFLAAVQRNILMRTFLNVTANIKMALPTYSRSDLLGEFYDEYLYRPVFGAGRSTPVEMRELMIFPPGSNGSFDPGKANPSRRARVPVLQINATTLNTGRSWRFSAKRMGEPPMPEGAFPDIDTKTRLRPPRRYDDLPPHQSSFPLGIAVAASAGVPGLFPPLAITGIYPDDVRVQLVDGGVFDNQGIATLMERFCDRIVVSDASGQMDFETDPATGRFSVIGRVNAILMDRIRALELSAGMRETSVPMALMHLRRGVDAESLSCLDAQGRPSGPRGHEGEPTVPPESYGVAMEVQKRLSRIRTDLDSFTHVEAWSLMLDGYLMSEAQLRGCSKIAELIPAQPQVGEERWGFLQMKPWIAEPTDDYLMQLDVAGEALFKYFRLRKTAAWAAGLSLAALLVGVGVVAGESLGQGLRTDVKVWHVLIVPPVILLLVFAESAVAEARGALRLLGVPLRTARAATVQAAASALGMVIVRMHLGIVDGRFLRLGKPEGLKKPGG